MKKTLQSAITTWITAAIILAVGILCIVAQNTDNNPEAYDAISLVLGITLIVVASLGLVLNALVLRRTATAETLADGVMLAGGIYLVVQKSAALLLTLLTDYAAYVILVLGALFVLDAILVLVFGLVHKSEVKAFIIPVVVELVLGSLAVVLGALALPSVNVISKRLTIFGVILLVFAVFLVLVGVLSFFGKKTDTVSSEDVVDAE